LLLKRALPFVAGALLALVACSASTAHIGSLQAGTDHDVTTPTTTFGEHDTIYAKADADNLPNKVTMQWQLIAENVKGVKPNMALPQMNVNQDMASDGTYTLSPPAAGWPDGTYKVIVTMMDQGTQRDQKSLEFTVGSGSTSSDSGSSDNSSSSDQASPAASPS